MKNRKLFWLNSIAIAGFLIIEANLTGCGKIDGLPAPASPNAIPGLPTAPPPPPVGVVSDTAGFYVIPRSNDKYTYVGHKGNLTMAEPCRAASGELVDCYIEAQELDLYMNGVDIQYNVPTTLCTYFEYHGYHYFSWPPGQGPSTAQLDTASDGSKGFDSNSDGDLNDVGDVRYDKLLCNQDPVTHTASSSYDFDHTKRSGPNCCGGTYDYTERSWNTTTLAYASTVTEDVSWGGSPLNCMAGPAVKNQTAGVSGSPRPNLVYVGGVGVNDVYAVKSPNSYGNVGNVFAANYYNAADFTLGFPNAYQSVSISTNGVTVIYPTNPVFYFRCLDASEEVISEIQLRVRSWTRKSNFLDLVANPALYQVEGAEPAPWNVGFDYFDRSSWYRFRTQGTGTLGIGFPRLSH